MNATQMRAVLKGNNIVWKLRCSYSFYSMYLFPGVGYSFHMQSWNNFCLKHKQARTSWEISHSFVKIHSKNLNVIAYKQLNIGDHNIEYAWVYWYLINHVMFCLKIYKLYFVGNKKNVYTWQVALIWKVMFDPPAFPSVGISEPYLAICRNFYQMRILGEPIGILI